MLRSIKFPSQFKDEKEVLRLIQHLEELYQFIDEDRVTTTDPNGNLTGRKYQRIIYDNSGTINLAVNTDGGTTWVSTALS